ncbi:hypothetical protein BH11BAC3_BH11BAC3_08440 [soil metagenome]
MSIIRKRFSILLAAGIALTLFSCNNSADTASETSTKTEDSVIASTPTPPAFEPFDVAELSHLVKDYAKWRVVFDGDSTARAENGMTTIVVAKEIEKPNNIMMAFKLADVQKARAFAADPRLKAAMDKAGVISKPTIEMFHVLRFNPDAKEKHWVQVTHKVKDFDAWLKVFDAEGTAKRAEDGLQDVVLARSIDDSNMVHMVFDIKLENMAKAKAHMASPELKKIMTDAGVVGMPKIEFYTDAE